MDAITADPAAVVADAEKFIALSREYLAAKPAVESGQGFLVEVLSKCCAATSRGKKYISDKATWINEKRNGLLAIAILPRNNKNAAELLRSELVALWQPYYRLDPEECMKPEAWAADVADWLPGHGMALKTNAERLETLKTIGRRLLVAGSGLIGVVGEVEMADLVNDIGDDIAGAMRFSDKMGRRGREQVQGARSPLTKTAKGGRRENFPGLYEMLLNAPGDESDEHLRAIRGAYRKKRAQWARENRGRPSIAQIRNLLKNRRKQQSKKKKSTK
jgi:hypothetical protein